MKLYVSDNVELYKDTVIGHLGNVGTADLLIHILQCWIACSVEKDTHALPTVLYCLGITYKYYSYLGFIPIKHNKEVKVIHNEIFNNTPHFIKKLSSYQIS